MREDSASTRTTSVLLPAAAIFRSATTRPRQTSTVVPGRPPARRAAGRGCPSAMTRLTFIAGVRRVMPEPKAALTQASALMRRCERLAAAGIESVRMSRCDILALYFIGMTRRAALRFAVQQALVCTEPSDAGLWAGDASSHAALRFVGATWTSLLQAVPMLRGLRRFPAPASNEAGSGLIPFT